MFLFSEGGGHHQPLIVEFVNHYLGKPVHEFQMAYTKPIWDKFFSNFGTDAEKVFGAPYTVDNAIPWYTIMFVIACILTVILIRLFKGKLSEDDPKPGQMTLEAGFLAIKDLVVRVIGEHGFKYFPIVATFACLVLISNLMGQFPMFMSPTASVNVTFALALSSFIYYNYVGISENGIIAHLGHLTGPRLPLVMTLIITPLIFSVELISNMIRPFTLGVRLFANMFADDKIVMEITNLYPPFTHFLVPLLLTVLGVFVAFVQTLVFTLLSMIYISEVSHPHDEHHEGHTDETHGEPAVATA
jgi:F-type H+-transporting ATPase subunit a